MGRTQTALVRLPFDASGQAAEEEIAPPSRYVLCYKHSEGGYMTLALTIGSVLLVLLGLVLGAWRGIRTGMLALAATLLGFMVSSYWGDAWATRLSEQYSFDARAFSFVLSAVLLLGPALIIGYGGGNILSRASTLKPLYRVIGAALGILNGLLQAGFLLRYASSLYPEFLSQLKAIPGMIWLHDGPPIVALVVAALGIVIVLIQALLQAFKARSTKPLSSTAQPNATVRLGPSSTAPTPALSPDQRQANQATVLEKVNKALDQR